MKDINIKFTLDSDYGNLKKEDKKWSNGAYIVEKVNEYTIDDLLDEIDDLYDQVSSLESEKEDLESEIQDLKKEIKELEENKNE